jgi:hypothetical protein
MPKIKWIERKFEFDLLQDEFPFILKRLSETPDKIEQLLYSVAPEVLKKKINNKWSIQEHIGHIIDLEKVHEGRIDDFISGAENLRAADMTNKKTNEANHNSKDIKQLLQLLRTTRENFIKHLEELDDNVLSCISLHPRLNQPMRVIDMASFVAEHDDHHINSMIELSQKLSEQD